jgi:hypothetical protein
MSPESAESLLQALGSKKASQHGIWSRGPCPLSPWTHKSGKDSNPSFGLVAADGEPARFHCFTCESGSLSKLLQLIEFHNHQTPGRFHGDLNKAREIIEMAESELPMLQPYSEFSGQKKKQFEEWPSYVLDTYLPVKKHDRAYAYCIKRGFSNGEMDSFNLRYDDERDMVVFPYWDVFGRFAGARGRRVILNGDSPSFGAGHHDYVWNGINNAGLVLYNEAVLNLPGPTVVVEGQVDCIKVSRVWPKTVGNLTAKPVLDKVQKLIQAEGVVLLLDGDQPGRDATKKWLDLLTFLGCNVLPVYLPYDDEAGIKTDPDSVGPEWLKNKFQEIGLIS